MNEVNWMQTYTGKRINPIKIKPEDICIEDIAHHLSLICRFNGACKFHYSVGQHSIYVAKLVSPGSRLPALLHDGAEAYLQDMVRGVKNLFKDFRLIEQSVQDVIYRWANLENIKMKEIKQADSAMLAAEAVQLMGNTDGWYLPEPPANIMVRKYTPEEVEQEFLDWYRIEKNELCL